LHKLPGLQMTLIWKRNLVDSIDNGKCLLTTYPSLVREGLQDEFVGVKCCNAFATITIVNRVFEVGQILAS
jgi:hypothetical protein